MVLNRAWGMKPPITEPAWRISAARGPTSSLQYGQMRSLMVMNARQCGHMRRESICIHHTTSVFSPRNFRDLVPISPAPVFCLLIPPPLLTFLQSKVPHMVKTEREHREDIVRIGQLVFQKGWVAANDGNITVRMDAE